MKMRRFVGKRRRRAARRLADLMSAKRVQANDRQEVAVFVRYLRGEMGEAEARAYELGEPR